MIPRCAGSSAARQLRVAQRRRARWGASRPSGSRRERTYRPGRSFTPIDRTRSCPSSAKRYRARHGFEREPDAWRTGKQRLERPLRLHLLSSVVPVQPVRRSGTEPHKGRPAAPQRARSRTALAMAAAGSASAAPTETVLHSFTGSDGANPSGGLIADSSGNLYGTAEGGRAGCIFGCGVVFKLSPGGTEKVLYSFTGGSDGAYPGGLIADSSGNLYGTTTYGGASGSRCGIVCGVVFKLSPRGTETVLHSFTGSDGRFPGSGLIADSSGNLYGTTHNGGVASTLGCSVYGCGTVFKLSPDGTETVLYSFRGRHGTFPGAGLIADSSPGQPAIAMHGDAIAPAAGS